MIIRSAFLEGSVSPEEQVSFDKYMCDTVVTEILKYPGILGVTLRRLVEADPGAAPVYMQFDLMFNSLEDMNIALESPIRDAVRDKIKAGMQPFKGRVVHIVSQQLADQNVTL